MIVRLAVCLLLLTISIGGYSTNPVVDIGLEALDIYSQRLKGDSLAIANKLDAAKSAYLKKNFDVAISNASEALKLSEKFPDSEFSIESILLLARSNRDLYLENEEDNYFSNTLKFYLKAITTLESVESKWRLPKIYKEYGDFYAHLNLTDLTIKNYEKAYNLKVNSEDDEFMKQVIEKLAILNRERGNYDKAISYYIQLRNTHERLFEEVEFINTLNTLSNLYREIHNYDSAISITKNILKYYQRTADKKQQIAYQSLIGEISYEAGNNDQADKAFKNYFTLVKKDSLYIEKEKASLRYIKNLITAGDIYALSTENGYWSDYKTSIRHYNDAYDMTDHVLYPELTSKILNRSATIFFKQSDFNASITYFNLALYHAEKCNDLEYISNNHIMLARAYDRIELWKDAFDHYELHAAYKDTLIQIAASKRQKIEDQLLEQEKAKVRVQQTLDLIETQEIQELSVLQKELQNIKLVNEVELLKQDAILNNMIIKAQKLAEERAKRETLLEKEKYKNEQNTAKIEKLNFESTRQNLFLKSQQQDRELEKERIKSLEQENSLARSKQAYYVLSIVLISLILIFILVIYWQKRKANVKLKMQNVQIESQSEKLTQAYKNLELLSRMGKDITSSLIIEEIIETIYENLNSLMDASVLGIGVFEENENRLYFPGVREKNQRLNDIYIDLSINQALAAYCFNNQKEVNLGNYFESYSEYIDPPQKPVAGDGNSTSVVYFPLTIGSKKLGVLTVQSFYENAFNEYHINIIRNIAIYAKIALENANFYRELEEQSHNLKKANISIKFQNKLIEEQNQQLLSINEEKNNLMNILAHDLRNPLATAMSMTELVRYEKGNLSAEQNQASEIIWRGLNRMNDMIRKILDIKAVESQQVNLDFEIVNANDLIIPLENHFTDRAEDKQIKLHFSSDCDDPFISADRHYLLQVMENLISNALKFSPVQKNIFVTVWDNEEIVRVSVKDEGPGIPEKEFGKLFKKFHKLSPRPTAGEQSIGLGLSIVKKYVEVMKGKVWCESKVGKGTTFIVEFKKEQVAVT